MRLDFIKKNLAFYLFLPVPFIFYWYTCLPSIGFADSVRYINDMKNLIFSTGVNNHNITALWGWVVQLLPVGDIAYRANLSCALAGALAICIFYISVYSLHRCWMTALISSLFLMISHSMWWHSTFIYEYAVNAVFVTTSLYLYVQLYKTNNIKYLYTLFFFSGLALFQHYLLGSLLIGAGTALIWRLIKIKDATWPTLWKCAVFFFIGLIPWLLTLMHDISLSHSFSKTISHAFGGGYKSLYFTRPLWDGLREYFFLLFMQFPSLYLAPIVTGIYFFIRKWKWHECTIGIIFSFMPVVIFEIGLSTWIWSLFAQYLSTYIIMAFWASFAIHYIVEHPKVLASTALRLLLIAVAVSCLAWTIYFYAHLSQWGENANSIWHRQFNNSVTYNTYRGNEFIANPNKRNYHDIANFCNLAFEKLPQQAQFWNSDSLFIQFNLYYRQFYQSRPDLELINISSFSAHDNKTYGQKLRDAYLSGKDVFFCGMTGPEPSFLSTLPNKEDYKFKKYYLNDTWWIYKLITKNDENENDNTLWKAWQPLPTDKPVVINVTQDNVLDFHEGEIIFQQDMFGNGPFWKNDDQIFFKPFKQGASIGFLLRFTKALKGNLQLTLTTASDAGLVEISLNNTPLTDKPIDLYSQGVTTKRFEFKDTVFENGNNVLSIKLVGKSKKSASMLLGIDTVEITPISP